MNTLEPIFATIDAHLRAKSAHAFLVTGNIGDDFPGADRRTFRSFESELAERNPHRLFLRLDLVRGLTVRTAEDAEKAVEALNPKAKGKKKEKDAITAAREQVDGPEEEDVLAENVGGALMILRKLVRLKEHKILLWVPRLEAIVPTGCANDAGIRATVDALLALFRDESASENGHLFVFGARAAAALESALIDIDSRLVQMRLPKPDESQRLAAVRQLTLDDDERRRLDVCDARLDEAHRAVVARKRELLEEHRPAMRSARQREDEIEQRVNAEFNADNATRQEAIRRLELRLEHAVGQVEAADREGIRLYEEWLRTGTSDRTDGRIVEPCVRANWDELEPGDRIFGQFRNETYWHVVLEKREKQVLLSLPVEQKQMSAPVRPPPRNEKGEASSWHWDAGLNDAISPPDGRIRKLNDRGQPTLRPCVIRLKGVTHPVVIQARIDAEKAAEAAALEKRLKKVEKEVAAARSAMEGARKRYFKSVREDSAVTGFREEVKRAVSEREAILKDRFSPPDLPLTDLARMTSGLGFRDLRDLFAMAQADQAPLDRMRVSKLKLKRLNDSYGHMLQVVEPTYGFEGIGGLDYVKDEMSRVVAAIRSGDVRAVPMGILLMGPPGTGKTGIAEALALEAGFSFIKLKNVRSMWVGESERRIEEILGAISDLAPCVVLRDEVDQEDSGRDAYQGDSGVSARIRQKWMQFLSEPRIRGRVLVVSCTNRPDLLDPAMKRTGRTDLRIPVLMPDAETLEHIYQVMFSKARYDVPHAIASFRSFAKSSVGRSGADIEHVCLESYRFARGNGRDVVTEDDLREALDDFIPSSDPIQILRMSLIALREASSKRLLPRNITLPQLEQEWTEKTGTKPDGSSGMN